MGGFVSALIRLTHVLICLYVLIILFFIFFNKPPHFGIFLAVINIEKCILYVRFYCFSKTLLLQPFIY